MSEPKNAYVRPMSREFARPVTDAELDLISGGTTTYCAADGSAGSAGVTIADDSGPGNNPA